MIALTAAAAFAWYEAPSGAPPRAAIFEIFAATYIVIAIGRLPGFRLDRAGAALVGASLMLAVGGIGIDEVSRVIDFDTVGLLLGMMIVVGNLRLSGFFRLVTGWAVARARHPLQLLAAVTLTSGIFSAFLLNDAICLVMTPLVADVARRLERNPVPYLLAVAMAANIGSVATITGNPQNILIGGFSQIPYGTFAAALAPVAAVGLIAAFAVIALCYPGEFRGRTALRLVPRQPAHMHAPLAVKSVLVIALMMAAFFAGQPPAKVALIAGGFMLLTRIVRSERIYREIDWPLLLMFAGLFVVVAGFEKALLTPEIVAQIGQLGFGDWGVLSAVTAILSNLVSNVPAVLVLRPFVGQSGDPRHAWLVVAMASTLAGNLTVLGSVANLIVVQLARAGRVTIGFWEYFRVGAPLTVLTILLGLWWLSAGVP
ncbi:MAG: anion transporter [Alphaproteobacteria bacterium]|nr:anion transporter [Alphaproteobacteria bacterium]MBV9154266.1 anion transporter [Alphaproteobacteria bacterium]MBV9584896.1 anion transporter [Alphaproteobacteria bacterium]